MQTKQQIQQLLDSAGLKPNRRLGQNFLIDLNLMRFLIDTANISNNDIVLETGCATGSLSESIAERAGFLVTVEIDETLAQIAQKQLAKYKNVTVINADILQNKTTINNKVTTAIATAKNQYHGRTLLVANLPYSTASPLITTLTKGPLTTDAMYVTVQKEVAEKMTAQPDNKNYGTLPIILNATGDIKILKTLKPTVFWPAPKVDSAMVSFIRNEEKIRQIHNIDIFSELVNFFMQHRRKMLKACTRLAPERFAHIHNWSLIFENCVINPHSRPERLTAQNYVAIANLCCEYLNKD